MVPVCGLTGGEGMGMVLGMKGKFRIGFVVAVVLAGYAGYAHGAEKEFRAARSVHLGYPGPEGSLFYNEVVVEKSVPGSYFMACGWSGGYFGIQERGNDKIVLFSVWDNNRGDDPNAVKKENRVEVMYEGEGVKVKRFGGEGTGGQSIWPYSWKIGETNRFVVEALRGEKGTTYSAWFYVPGTNGWKQLASFRIPRSRQALAGYYSFIEDFRRDITSVQDLRRARFGNGWIKTSEGKWLPLIQAKFTASNAEFESKENIDAGTVGGMFFLATGGEIKSSHALNGLMALPGAPAEQPELLKAFLKEHTGHAAE
jgi:hypothetical protein